MRTFREFLAEQNNTHIHNVSKAIEYSHPKNWSVDDWDALDQLHDTLPRVKRQLPKEHPLHKSINNFNKEYKSGEDEGVGASKTLHKQLKEYHGQLTGNPKSGNKIKTIWHENEVDKDEAAVNTFSKKNRKI